MMLNHRPSSCRPVGEPGPANDIALGHCPVVTRVVTVVAIVTENEVFVCRDFYYLHLIVWLCHGIFLLKGDPVDEDLIILDLYEVAGKADYAFDIGMRGIKRGAEDYYISSLRIGDEVTCLTDHDPVTFFDIRQHTAILHSIALYVELEEDKDGYGDENSYTDFAEDLHQQRLIVPQTVKSVHSLWLCLLELLLNANIIAPGR